MRWKMIELQTFAIVLMTIAMLVLAACIPELPEERLSDCLEECAPKSQQCFAGIAQCHGECAIDFTCSSVCQNWDEPRCVALCTDQRATCDTLCEQLSAVCLAVTINCAEECIDEFETAMREEL